MANGMDERRRGLEEDYFRKKDQEAIQKLREKIKLAAQAKEAGTSSMKCPRCDGTLKEVMIEQVLSILAISAPAHGSTQVSWSN